MSKPISRECSLFRASGAPMGTATLTKFTRTEQITKRDMRYRWNKMFAASNAAFDKLRTEYRLTISGKDFTPIEEAFHANEFIKVKALGFDFKCLITSLNSLSDDHYEAELVMDGLPLKKAKDIAAHAGLQGERLGG